MSIPFLVQIAFNLYFISRLPVDDAGVARKKKRGKQVRTAVGTTVDGKGGGKKKEEQE